jgi:hypothetical protein
LLTKEEVEILKSNTNVRKVSQKTVSYTLEFKEWFWREYNTGKSVPDIFEAAGFDIVMLGEQRMYGFFTTLRRTKERGIPFTDGRDARQVGIVIPPDQHPEPATKKNTTSASITERDLRKLIHQVNFLTQEIEFIKKIISLSKGEKSK